MSKELPQRLILTFGEIVRIEMLADFCESEDFTEDFMIGYVRDDMVFSFDSKILPKNYQYEVPKGYVIKGFND